MKRVYLITVLTALLMMMAVPAFAASEREENNNPGQATVIKIDEPMEGVTTGTSDQDWYLVRIPKDGWFQVSFEHEKDFENSFYWEIRLFQADGKTRLCNCDHSNVWRAFHDSDLSTTKIGVKAGSYYISVRCSRGGALPYTLTVSHGASDHWEKEYNTSPKSATPMTVNEDWTGSLAGKHDEDWYRVDVPADGALDFSFSHELAPENKRYWSLRVYLEDGTTPITGCYWQIYGHEDLKTEAVGLPAGTYYLQVRDVSSDQAMESPYTLRVGYQRSDHWEKEANDDVTRATAVTLNEKWNGSMTNYEDEDWYLLELPEDGHLTLQLEHQPIPTNRRVWNVSVFQADGVTALPSPGKAGWDIPGSENLTTAKIGLEAGKYYIRVRFVGRDAEDLGLPYCLTAEYAPSGEWEQEGNNDAQNASELELFQTISGSIMDKSDEDWYRFQARGNEISYQFDRSVVSSPDEYVLLQFYEANASTSIGDSVRVKLSDARITGELGSLPSGTYFVRVRSRSDDPNDPEPYTLQLTEKHEHVYQTWETVKEPSCTKPGESVAVCTVCAETVTRTIPATGHHFGPWQTTRAASCTREGEQTRSCSVCGLTEQRTIGMLPHSLGEEETVSGSVLLPPIVTRRVCTVCGEEFREESYRFAWVLPVMIVSAALAGAGAFFLKKRRQQKRSFTCPFCFETHRMEEVQFRCTNTQCGCVPDAEKTRYEQGDPAQPLQDRVTFPGTNAIRNSKGVPLSAVCPSCGGTTARRICPSCHNTLPESSLLGEDLIISVIGPRGSGKSHFVGVLIHELVNRIAPAFHGSLEPFDDTKDRYERSFGTSLYLKFEKLNMTPSSLSHTDNGAYRPLIYTLKLRTVNRMKSFTIVFFDTAGEDLNDIETMATVNRYICKSAGVIFLVDPLQLSAVAALMDADAARRAGSGVSGSQGSMEEILTRVSAMIRGDRGLKENQMIDVPVAVAVSKLDVLTPLLPAKSPVLSDSPHCRMGIYVSSDGNGVSAAMEKQLCDWGGGALAMQVKCNYRHCAFFGVSALGLHNNPEINGRISEPRPHRIEDPILWLWKQLGIIGS